MRPGVNGSRINAGTGASIGRREVNSGEKTPKTGARIDVGMHRKDARTGVRTGRRDVETAENRSKTDVNGGVTGLRTGVGTDANKYSIGMSKDATTTRVDERTGASTCRPDGMAGATGCKEGVKTGKAAPSTDASVELVAEASKTLSQLPVSHAAPNQGSSNNHISKKGLE